MRLRVEDVRVRTDREFIDWLFNLMESPKEVLSAKSRDLLKATLLSLRALPEFKKKAVWTRAYGW